jgi:hypothetical protein
VEGIQPTAVVPARRLASVSKLVRSHDCVPDISGRIAWGNLMNYARTSRGCRENSVANGETARGARHQIRTSCKPRGGIGHDPAKPSEQRARRWRVLSRRGANSMSFNFRQGFSYNRLIRPPQGFARRLVYPPRTELASIGTIQWRHGPLATGTHPFWF